MVVPLVVGLAADPAPEAHLAHHLEDCLVYHPLPVDCAQLHGDLAVVEAVRERSSAFRAIDFSGTPLMPHRLGAAFTVQPTPTLQRGFAGYLKALYHLGLARPDVDHGPRRGSLCLVVASGSLHFHG